MTNILWREKNILTGPTVSGRPESLSSVKGQFRYGLKVNTLMSNVETECSTQ